MDQNVVLNWGHISGVIAAFFAIFTLFYKLIDKKFDKVDKKFDKIDLMFEKVDVKFDKLQNSIKEVGDKLSAFEKHAEHRLTKMEMEAKNTNQRLLTIENFLIPKKVYQFETPEPPHPEKQAKEN